MATPETLPQEKSLEQYKAENEQLLAKMQEQDAHIEALMQELEALMQEPQSMPQRNNVFVEDDIQYQIIPAILKYKDAEYTAQEILDDEGLRKQLLTIAWEGREEANFHKNGIFKIIY